MNYKSIIPYIVISILFVIICLKQCKSVDSPKPIIITKINTIHIHDTVPGKPSVLISTVHDTLWRDSVKYLPSTNYDGLLNQYESLGDKYFSKSIYKTPYSLGKYGTAETIDTIVENQITGSSLSYDITFKDTITITTPIKKPTRQIYIGGNLFFTKTNVNSLIGGFIYKDRKDNIYQLNTGVDINGNVLYGAGLYYKIKL
jgi:hypothetical protein